MFVKIKIMGAATRLSERNKITVSFVHEQYKCDVIMYVYEDSMYSW